MILGITPYYCLLLSIIPYLNHKYYEVLLLMILCSHCGQFAKFVFSLSPLLFDQIHSLSSSKEVSF